MYWQWTKSEEISSRERLVIRVYVRAPHCGSREMLWGAIWVETSTPSPPLTEHARSRGHPPRHRWLYEHVMAIDRVL